MTMKRPVPSRLLVKQIRALCGRPAWTFPVAALLSLATLSTAWADPTGGIVVSGQGSISTPAPGTTVIEQASQHLQLNWNTFDVAANETVQFQQPSASAVALNRILDQNPSQVFGRIDANGQVILVNPNGLLFGQSAQLNVGSLVASSLDVVGFDAATGRYTFGTSGTDIGAIINEGSITAGPGGSVTLLGGRVTNNGSIVAIFGTVNLAAGRSAILDLAGDGLLQLEVDSQLVENESGAAAAVENNGSVQANGGQVLLTAQALDGVFVNLVNNTGVVRANRIDDSGGTIRLVGTGGKVRSSGTLDASAGDAASAGGRVEMLGEQVGLFGNARVDVSGATGGGTALIGGDYQGKNPNVPNATRTYVGANAVIDADAGSSGDGGKVIVWADEFTRYGGHISARGGTQSGDGGFTEVSGKESMAFTGSADLGAAQGDGGTLLLDPLSITIAAGSSTDTDIDDGTYAFAEDSTTDAVIGDATIESLLSGGFDVRLQGASAIVQNADADIDVSSTPGAAGHSFTMESATIVLNGDILLNGGALNARADGYVDISGTINTNGGDVEIIADNSSLTMYDGSSISAGSGGILLDAAQDIRLTQVTTSGTVTVEAGQNILDDFNDTTRIVADTAFLTGASVGELFNGALDTQVGTLNVTSTSGGIGIIESDDLTLSAAGNSNVVSVRTLDGDLAVNASSGENFDLDAGGAGSDLTVNGLLQALNTVDLTAGSVGARGDIIGSSNHLVQANVLVAVGANIGSSSTPLATAVERVRVVADDGSIYLNETDSVGLWLASAREGSINVTAASGDIRVEDVQADSVVLTATGGRIYTDPYEPHTLAADTLTLNAQSLGRYFGPFSTIYYLDMSVDSLIATVAQRADIAEADGLTLTNIAGGSGSFNLQSAGDITVQTLTSGGSVALASGGSILDDNNDGTLIQASGLSLTAANTLGTVDAFGAANNADIGNSLDLRVTGALSAVATSDIGQINLNIVGGTPSVAASAIRVGNSATGRAGTIVLHSTGNLDLSGVAAGAIAIGANNTTSVGLRSDATLTLPSHSVTNQNAGVLLVDGSADVVNSGGSRNLSFNANHLTFNTGAAGTTTLNTSVETLDATTGGHRNLTVNETDGVTVRNVNVGFGEFTLTAGGAITDDGDDNTRITANIATLSGAVLGTSGNAIDTNVSELTATASAGGAYIVDSDRLEFSATAAGELNVQTASGLLTAQAASGDGVTLVAGGNGSGISIRGDLNAGTGDVSLTAGTPVDRGLVWAFEGLVSGDAMTIVGDSIALTSTAVNSLDVTGSTLQLREADALDLTAHMTGDYLDVQTGSGLLTVNNVTGTSATLTSGGSIHIEGAIAVSGDASLRAATGEITDGTSGAASVSANELRMTSGAVGSAANPIELRVAELYALSTAAAGGVHVAEEDGLQVGVRATGAGGDVSVTSATGNIDVYQVIADDSVTLTATAGGINANNYDATQIVTTTGTVSLNAATNIGTVTDFDAASATDTGASLDVQAGGALSAVVASNSGAINLNIAGAPTVTAGAIRLGDASGGAGSIVLQSAGGSLNLSNLAAGAIDLGANNMTRIALVSDALTLPSNVGFMAQPAGRLSIRVNQLTDHDGGTVDVALAADALDIYANVTAPINLYTDVGLLDARLYGGNVAVYEAGDITLADVISSRSIALTAAGAILDDGDDSTGISSGGAGITLVSSSIGADGNDVDVVGPAITATASTGSAYLNLMSYTPLTASAALGSVNVRSTSSIYVAGPVSAGNGVTLTADGDASAIQLLGAVNGGTGTVRLIAGTPTLRGLIYGAGEVSGASLVATGSSLGLAGLQRLNTSVGSLDATATSMVYIAEEDGLNLRANAGVSVDIVSPGPLVVDAVSAQAVTLSTDSHISDGAGGAPAVVAGSLTLSGSAIGFADNSFDTQVQSLATTTTAGDAYIRESDGIIVNGSAAGLMDLRTETGDISVAGTLRGNGVTLVTGSGGGNITNGRVDGGAGTVRLTAGEGSAIQGAINGIAVVGQQLTASGSTINATSRVDVLDLSAPGTINVTNYGDVTLDANAGGGPVGSVDVYASGGDLTVNTVNATSAFLLAFNQTLHIAGSIVAQDAALVGAIIDDAGGQTSVTASNLALSAASQVGTDGNPLNVHVDTLYIYDVGELHVVEQDGLALPFAQATGDLNVTAGGALTVGEVYSDGAVALGSGLSIADDGDTDTFIEAGSIALTAANDIGSVANIDAGTGADIGSAITVRTGGALSARSNSDLGQINLQIIDLAPTVVAGGISVGNGSNAAGRIALHAPEDLDLSGLAPGAISAGSNDASMVLLRAGNVLTLPSVGTFTDRSLGHLFIRGADVVDNDSAPHSLSLQASHLDFLSGATDDTRLDTNVDLLDATINTGRNLTVNEADNLSVGAINAAGGSVNITALGAITDDGLASTRIVADSATLAGRSIGMAEDGVDTQVTTLAASTDNGLLHIDEADDLLLLSATAFGALDVATVNGELTVNAASGIGVDLRAGGAGSGIDLNGVVNGSTGDVTLIAGSPGSRGTIESASGALVTGNTLTAVGSSIGASDERLNTAATTFNASSSNGAIFVSEADGLTLANVSSAVGVDVTTATGNIAVSTVNAPGAVTLTAAAGAITDDGNDTTRLSGNVVTLNARSIGAASTLAGTQLSSSPRLDIEATTLDATASAGGIFIDELNGLERVNLRASAAEVGDIELLTRSGDLNLQSVNAADTLLLSAGGNVFATANSSGIVARVAELRAGTADASAGRIGTPSSPLDLQVSPGNSLRLLVPEVNAHDQNRAPAVQASAEISLALFAFSSDALSGQAGFGQLRGLREITPLAEPPEKPLPETLHSQTGIVLTTFSPDWRWFDSDVSPLDIQEPSVCLPLDQRVEASVTPGC